MVYAYDRITPMPTKDLYDTLLMAMAINAAKDQYDKAEKRLDDLQDQLGNFYSPFAKDMQWYQTKVEDRIKNTLDDLYARGIDPLRSAEGRAALRQLERSVPKSIVTKMKANAALGEKRRDLIAQLKAKGLYSKDFDDFMRRENGLGDPESFGTVGDDGTLNTFEGTPYEYTDANTFLTPIVKDIKEGSLTKEDMEKYYPDEKYDPRYQYKARTEGMLRNAIAESMSNSVGDPTYRYLRDVARRQLIHQNILNGGNPGYIPSEQEIDQRYIDNSTGTVSRFITRPTAELDDIAKEQIKADINVRAHERMKQIDQRYSGVNQNPINPNPTLPPDDHDSIVWGSAVSNLYGGEHSSYLDFYNPNNMNDWASKGSGIEKEIRNECHISATSDNPKGSFDWKKWKERHSAPYNEKWYADHTRRTAVDDPDGLKSGTYIPVVRGDTKKMFTEAELARKNADPTIRNMAKHRKNDGDDTRLTINNAIAAGTAKKHGKRKTFSQVESDGKLHVYAEIGISANSNNKKQSFVMYEEMFSSDTGTILPSKNSYPERMPNNFSATRPVSASAEQTYESTHVQNQ